MSGRLKPSVSQPRKEMEVSLFFLHVSLPLPFVGELSVLTLEGQREAGLAVMQFCLDEAGSWEPLSLSLPSAGETP